MSRHGGRGRSLRIEGNGGGGAYQRERATAAQEAGGSRVWEAAVDRNIYRGEGG
jgi:hypothetical protein